MSKRETDGGSQLRSDPISKKTPIRLLALLAAAYGLEAGWQAVGLTEYVFGEGGDESLLAYYADGSRALTASCSAVHLSPLLADEATARAARNTARKLKVEN